MQPSKPRAKLVAQEALNAFWATDDSPQTLELHVRNSDSDDGVTRCP
jgi:hypothetical protein